MDGDGAVDFTSRNLVLLLSSWQPARMVELCNEDRLR